MKKYIVCIIVILIFLIGIASYQYFNNEKKSYVHLKILCSGQSLSGNYNKGSKFKCDLLGNEFEIKIEEINNEKIKLNSSTYGLFPRREDGSISLIDKINEFELQKGEKLTLALQTTDVTSDIVIIWQ